MAGILDLRSALTAENRLRTSLPCIPSTTWMSRLDHAEILYVPLNLTQPGEQFSCAWQVEGALRVEGTVLGSRRDCRGNNEASLSDVAQNFISFIYRRLPAHISLW